MLRGLGLNAEQQAKIKAIQKTFREAMKNADSREARRKAFKARMESVRKVLTEEQFKKLRERRRGRHDRRGGGRDGERRGRRGGRRDDDGPTDHNE